MKKKNRKNINKWKIIIDFTKINKKGIKAKKLLKYL